MIALPHSGRRWLRDHPRPLRVPVYEHPEWILQAVLDRAESIISQNVLYHSAPARELFSVRFCAVTGREPPPSQWFREVYGRSALEGETAQLSRMSATRPSLTGVQLVELLGVAKVVQNAGDTDYHEFDGVFRIHYLLPMIAQYLAYRQRYRPDPARFMEGMPQAPLVGAPNFGPYFARGQDRGVPIAHVMPYLWGVALTEHLNSHIHDYRAGMGCWAPRPLPPPRALTLPTDGKESDWAGDDAVGTPLTTVRARRWVPPRRVPAELTRDPRVTGGEYVLWVAELMRGAGVTPGTTVVTRPGSPGRFPAPRVELLDPVNAEETPNSSDGSPATWNTIAARPARVDEESWYSARSEIGHPSDSDLDFLLSESSEDLISGQHSRYDWGGGSGPESATVNSRGGSPGRGSDGNNFLPAPTPAPRPAVLFLPFHGPTPLRRHSTPL